MDQFALQRAGKERIAHEEPVVIFRLGNEWLALSARIFAEVSDFKKIHKVPHRDNKTLLGIVNLRGQLKLCVALHHLLELEKNDLGFENSPPSQRRMLAIQNEGEQWIFPVNEVFGIYHVDMSQIENTPITVAKSTANYLRGIISWTENNVGLLDEELIFYSLKRSLE